RRRHTRSYGDWSSDVCSSDLRTIAEDQILQHQSGRVPLDSFCVEPGRWSRRGWESDSTFSGSTWGLASKDLKLAARLHSNQREEIGRASCRERVEGAGGGGIC